MKSQKCLNRTRSTLLSPRDKINIIFPSTHQRPPGWRPSGSPSTPPPGPSRRPQRPVSPAGGPAPVSANSPPLRSARGGRSVWGTPRPRDGGPRCWRRCSSKGNGVLLWTSAGPPPGPRPSWGEQPGGGRSRGPPHRTRPAPGLDRGRTGQGRSPPPPSRREHPLGGREGQHVSFCLRYFEVPVNPKNILVCVIWRSTKSTRCCRCYKMIAKFRTVAKPVVFAGPRQPVCERSTLLPAQVRFFSWLRQDEGSPTTSVLLWTHTALVPQCVLMCGAPSIQAAVDVDGCVSKTYSITPRCWGACDV